MPGQRPGTNAFSPAAYLAGGALKSEMLLSGKMHLLAANFGQTSRASQQVSKTSATQPSSRGVALTASDLTIPASPPLVLPDTQLAHTRAELVESKARLSQEAKAHEQTQLQLQILERQVRHLRGSPADTRRGSPAGTRRPLSADRSEV